MDIEEPWSAHLPNVFTELAPRPPDISISDPGGLQRRHAQSSVRVRQPQGLHKVN